MIMMKEIKEFSTLDYIFKPLDAVRNLLEKQQQSNLIETSNIDEFDIPTYFKNVFNTTEDLMKIPSLNDTPIFDIPNHSLVRFRAMIQNTGLGHEIYASSYETRSQNGQKKWKFNKYTDDMDMDIDDNEILDFDLNSESSSIYNNNQLEERHLYYCVSVPGETDWNIIYFLNVYVYAYNNNSRRKQSSSSTETSIGTSIEEIIRSTANLSLDNDGNNNNNNNNNNKTTGERNSRLLKKLVSKYPFPNEHHVAAIVKIYGKDDDILKVAEVVEFIGVLIHPSININESNNNKNDNNNLQEDGNEFCFDSMTISNIPCMHSIFYSNNNIHHSGNPLLLTYYNNNNLYEVNCQASDTRRNLLQYIASVFGGDEVVAEFVLLQLLSRVYSRKNGLTLGKFTLNICNIPYIPSTIAITSSSSFPPSVASSASITSSPSTLVHTNQFSKNVSKVLSSILPKYHDLPLTLSTLNEIDYFPNSNSDELDSGVFQVSKGTWFLIDETVMKEGKLNDTGVRNLQALNNLIDNQRLLYTFPFYDFEFETDIGIIVLSEAKPFLPVDCILPLLTNNYNNNNYNKDLPEEILVEFRKYLGVHRYIENYFIPDDVSKYIENQFVIQRRNASRNGQIFINHFDLQLRMTLARLVTLSFGESKLTEELWDYTERLDEQRKQRMENFEQR
ncbi:hypothetical protein Glove_452g44 [Diversispora epigaea]|uniref:Mini-chromosome maintenance complex-binding protein n=1 Tax=Diversispora epigaea TaxID=1348612 RepID=A0A397GY90_9GLOM|nr:hypothetical protein Glove_452g44 [Diversispora epigaea]